MYSDLGSGLARVRFRHFDRARGIDLPGASPDAGMFIGVDRGRAITGNGRGIGRRADVLVQLYPALVQMGQSKVPSPDPNPERDWRAALCILRDGKLAFAVAPSSPMGLFADKLRAMGVVHAGYTDGGSSTSLVLPPNRIGSPNPRAVATWLTVLPQGSGLVAIGVLGLLGALWYATHGGST
jgi:hypothetical protein